MFWRLTLREIDLVLDGVNSRRRHEANIALQAAWLNARLSAYPPEKPAQFPKLSAILQKKPERGSAEANWQDKRDQVKAWVASLKR